MPPAVLAECCQLNEGCNLNMENGEICTTGTGIKISLDIGALRRMQITFGLCQIDLPVHTLSVRYNGSFQSEDGSFFHPLGVSASVGWTAWMPGSGSVLPEPLYSGFRLEKKALSLQCYEVTSIDVPGMDAAGTALYNAS